MGRRRRCPCQPRRSACSAPAALRESVADQLLVRGSRAVVRCRPAVEPPAPSLGSGVAGSCSCASYSSHSACPSSPGLLARPRPGPVAMFARGARRPSPPARSCGELLDVCWLLKPLRGGAASSCLGGRGVAPLRVSIAESPRDVREPWPESRPDARGARFEHRLRRAGIDMLGTDARRAGFAVVAWRSGAPGLIMSQLLGAGPVFQPRRARWRTRAGMSELLTKGRTRKSSSPPGHPRGGVTGCRRAARTARAREPATPRSTASWSASALRILMRWQDHRGPSVSAAGQGHRRNVAEHDPGKRSAGRLAVASPDSRARISFTLCSAKCRWACTAKQSGPACRGARAGRQLHRVNPLRSLSRTLPRFWVGGWPLD